MVFYTADGTKLNNVTVVGTNVKYSGYGAANTANGNTGDFCETATATTAYITYDLGSSVELSKITVYARTLNSGTRGRCIKDYAVYVNDTAPSYTKTVDAYDESVTWTSSNEAVVTVDENGKVTAVGVGEATITVTTNDGGYTDTCVITVTNSTSEEPEVPGEPEVPDEPEVPGADEEPKEELNFFQRIWLAIVNFFKKLFGIK